MRKGFTLIEMLVVVVIVGILAAALIPRISSAKDRAENAGAIKDVSDIVTALEVYKGDNGDMYPVSASCNGTVKTECSLSGVYNSLSKYLKSIPQGNTKLPQWTIGNGYTVPAGTAYGYVGTGKRYILSYRFTDTRDGQRYKAVRMPDERRWMAENLNFKTANSSCYDDIEINCDNDYGRLYDWNDAQTACPAGWKLPSNDEWTTMLNAVEEVYGGVQNHQIGGNGSAGLGRNGSFASYHLKTTHGSTPTDSFGFSVLFAGGLRPTTYQYTGSYGFFWTATPSGGNATNRWFEKGTRTVYNHVSLSRNYKTSVRCIQ